MPDLSPLKFAVAIKDEATAKLKNIEEAFSNLDNKTITVKVNGIEDLKQLLSALQHQQVQELGKNVGSAINEATKNLQKEAQDAIRSSLEKLAIDLVAVKEAIQHDNFTAFSARIMKCAEAVEKLNGAFDKFHVTIGRDDGLRNFMTGLGEVIRNVRTTMGVLNGSNNGVTANTDAMSRSIKVAQHETERLSNDLTRAQRIIETFGDKGFNVDNLRRYSNVLIEVRENLMRIERNGGIHPVSGLTASQYLHSEDVSRLVSLLRSEMNKLSADANKAGLAIHQFTTEEERLAHAIVKSTSEMFSQSQVLNDLKSMATQYLGVWGGQQFLNNIIQIGGQLEMQRLSIGAILGDTAQANDLFEKIKGLAVQSPFGVVELDQMTKQLTAYGFEYHELFDMTKRLADISAATGTGVDRLALALGHVRSEAALSGYTLRQFSMANIPLAQKLSERLSEIEKRFVSVAEVRKRVSKKEIGYEDVVAVLKDLTNEGGMFYNAEEIMSRSVKAKFKNLKDAMDIMYGDMAESKLGEGLKEVATILTTLTREWEKLGAAIAVVAGAWAIKKGSSFLSSNAMLAYSDGVTRLRMNLGSLTAEEMRELAYSNNLTKQRLLEAVATGKVTVEDAKLAAAKWGLNEAQLQEIATGQRTVASMTANSIATSKYSMAQLRAIATTRQFALFGSKNLAVAMNVIATNAKMAGAALLSFAKAAWPVALITAGVEAWMHYRGQAEQAGEAASSSFTKGEEAVRNLKEALDKLPTSVGLDDGALRNGIKEAIKELRNYNPAIVNDIIANVNSTGINGKPLYSLSEQYDYLRGKVEETRKELEEFQRTSSAQESALKATGGLLNDNVFDDINDYFDTRKEFVEDTNDFYAKYKAQVRTAIDAAREEDEAFKKRTEYIENYAERMRVLVTESEKYPKAFNIFWGSPNMQTTDFRSKWGGVLGQGAEMKKELDNWAKGLKATLEGSFGYDFSRLTQEQYNNVRRHIWEFTNSDGVSGIDEEMRKWMRNYVGNLLNITFSTNTEQVLKEFDEMQKHIEGLVGKDWVIKLKLQSVGSFEELYDQLNKNVKDAKETLRKLGSGFTKERKAFLESAVADENFLTGDEKEYREKYLLLENSKAAAEKKNWKLDALEDKKSGGRKSTEDVNAKAVRERVRIIKEAADAFQYWRQKVGDKGAWAHVEAEFGNVLNDIDVTAKNVDDLKGNLEKTLTSKEFNAIKDEKVKREIKKEVAKDTAQIERKEFEKTTDEFASKVQIELDSLTRAWEIFNNVRESTGDVELAVKLSGVGYQNGRNRNLADALKEKIQKDLSNIKVGLTIDFDINMSDEQIQREVENKFVELKPVQGKDESKEDYLNRLSDYESKIKGIVEETKKWRDIQRDVYKTDLQLFGEIIGSASDYESEIAKIDDEFKKSKESLDRLLSAWKNNERDERGNRKGIDQAQYDKALKMLETGQTSKKWQKETAYINLMNNALSMTKNEILAAAQTQEDSLNRQLKEGTMSSKEFVEEMMKLNDVMNNYNTGNTSLFGASFFGGSRGRADYYKNNAMYWLTRFSESSYKDSPEAQEAYNEYENYLKKYESTERGIKATDNLTNTFQTLQSTADFLSNVFKKLGKSTSSAAMEDIGSIIGGGVSGASSMSWTGNGWAMAAGAAIGIIGGLIDTGDNMKSRYIEELKANTDALENNSQQLRTNRERTLGYDRGELAKQYLAFYQKGLQNGDYDIYDKLFDEYHTLSGAEAMSDYYKEAVKRSSYEQELKNLEEERKKYIEMYSAENTKKNSSDSALEEYKEKITELDDKIRFFAEDVANNLFGIDLKGWADEIGDALMTAFENGEDAAEAFNNTVQDIMRNVLRKMLSIGIIQPMMERLQKKLFGENGKGGSFDATNPEGTIDAAMRDVAEFFGEGGEGQKMINATQTFYDKWEQFMKSKGLTLADENSSSSASSSIKSITEQTADLLASYINGIRADVSVNRAMIAEYFPMYYAVLTSGNESLRTIENHTAAIMRSNDIIAQKMESLDNNINGLKNKTWKVPIA